MKNLFKAIVITLSLIIAQPILPVHATIINPTYDREGVPGRRIGGGTRETIKPVLVISKQPPPPKKRMIAPQLVADRDCDVCKECVCGIRS